MRHQLFRVELKSSCYFPKCHESPGALWNPQLPNRVFPECLEFVFVSRHECRLIGRVVLGFLPRWTIIRSITGPTSTSWRTPSLWRRSTLKETPFRRIRSTGGRSCWRCPVCARSTPPSSASERQGDKPPASSAVFPSPAALRALPPKTDFILKRTGLPESHRHSVHKHAFQQSPSHTRHTRMHSFTPRPTPLGGSVYISRAGDELWAGYQKGTPWPVPHFSAVFFFFACEMT